VCSSKTCTRRPGIALIEDKASGTQLIQELIGDGLHAAARKNDPDHRSSPGDYMIVVSIQNGA
jgi:hypothetical protein